MSGWTMGSGLIGQVVTKLVVISLNTLSPVTHHLPSAPQTTKWSLLGTCLPYPDFLGSQLRPLSPPLCPCLFRPLSDLNNLFKLCCYWKWDKKDLILLEKKDFVSLVKIKYDDELRLWERRRGFIFNILKSLKCAFSKCMSKSWQKDSFQTWNRLSQIATLRQLYLIFSHRKCWSAQNNNLMSFAHQMQ